MRTISQWPGWLKIAAYFLIASIFSGIILGVCSPTITGTVTGTNLELDDGSAQARFLGLVWYSAIATVGGVLGAVVAWRCEPDRRGLRTEFLSTLFALIAGFGIFFWGHLTASFLHPLPAVDTLSRGDVVQWVPVSFSVAALPMMPFFTALTYWALLVVHPDAQSD